jgi:hypothetical protein
MKFFNRYVFGFIALAMFSAAHCYSQVLEDYTVFGSQSVYAKDQSTVTGNIGSNNYIEIGNDGKVYGNFVSRSSGLLKDRGLINGDVRVGSSTFNRQNQTVVTGTVSLSQSIPTITIPSLASVPVNSQNKDITINQTLSPGTYGDIHVFSNIQLTLSAGIYNAKSLILDADAKVLIASGTKAEINLLNTFTVADRVQIDGSRVLLSANISVYYHQSTQISIGTNAKISCKITAPNATVMVNSQSIVAGPIYAKNIQMEATAQAGQTSMSDQDFANYQVTDSRMEASCQSYPDGGAHYVFKIINGKVYFSRDGVYMGEFGLGSVSLVPGGAPVTAARYITYNKYRNGETFLVPAFDMIEADNNSVLVKVKNANRFFWGQVQIIYPDDYRDYKNNGAWKSVNSYYVKVDPEEGNPQNPIPGFQFDPNMHFGSTNFVNNNPIDISQTFTMPGVTFPPFTTTMPDLKDMSTDSRIGLFPDVMQVKVEKNTWYEIDATPPRNNVSGTIREMHDAKFDARKKALFDELLTGVKKFGDVLIDNDGVKIKNALKTAVNMALPFDSFGNKRGWARFGVWLHNNWIQWQRDFAKGRIDNADFKGMISDIKDFAVNVINDGIDYGWDDGTRYEGHLSDLVIQIKRRLDDGLIGNKFSDAFVNAVKGAFFAFYNPNDDEGKTIEKYMNNLHAWYTTFHFPSDIFEMEEFSPYRYSPSIIKTRIKIKEVLDIGVGNPHRYEHCRKHLGGELQDFFADHEGHPEDIHSTVMSNAMVLNSLVDGNGYNDGTLNFFMLAKVGMKSPTETGYHDSIVVLWLDEQEYFAERWHVIHPKDNAFEGAAATMLSVFPGLAIDDGIDMDAFAKSYWTPYSILTTNARMANSRYATVIADDNLIYSTSFFWATTDRTWRWRNYPSLNVGAGESIDKKSVQIRDDMTIYFKGKKDFGSGLVDGYWYQRYLGAHNEFKGAPNPGSLSGQQPVAGYDHVWNFMAKDVFEAADKNFFRFGMYDRITSTPRTYNAYKGIDPRTHIYKLPSVGYWLPNAPYSLYTDMTWQHSITHPMYTDMQANFKKPIQFRLIEPNSSVYALAFHPKDDDLMLKNMIGSDPTKTFVIQPDNWYGYTISQDNLASDLNVWADCEVDNIGIGASGDGIPRFEFQLPADIDRYVLLNLKVGIIENGTGVIKASIPLSYLNTDLWCSQNISATDWDNIKNYLNSAANISKYGTKVWVEDAFGNGNVFETIYDFM